MAVKTFTAGAVLTTSDTNTFLANSGLVYVTQTTLSGASVNIDNCFSSTYASYRIVIQGASCASGTLFVTVAFRPTSVSGYNTSFYDTRQENGAFTTDTNIAYWVPSLIVDATNMSGGVIDIHNPQTAVTASFQAQGTDPRTTGGFIRNAAGFHNQTNQYTGVTIGCLSGTFDAGTATVYGYRLG